jgi:hypothetical protein
MKVYITAPFDDNGIEEVDADIVDQANGILGYTVNGLRITAYRFDWHTDRDDAVATAREHRRARIAEAFAALDRLKTLPEIV